MTYAYHLKSDDGIVHDVCKSFFLTTLGYHSKNDRLVMTVMGSSLSAVTSPKDRRSRHDPANKLNTSPIRAHIESVGPSITHYRREHAPNRHYLPSDVTIRFMCTDYKEKHPNSKCSYETYRKQLRNMNISFTKLGEEECEKCTQNDIHCKATGHKQHVTR